jgi:putative transposase
MVLVTKYRPAVFTDEMPTFCEHTMRAVCADLDVELVEFNGKVDDAHLLVHYPPTPAISALIHRLNGRTAYTVRRESIDARVRARTHGHHWSPSYSAVSCAGAPPSIIKQHIDRQPVPRTPGNTQRQTDGPTPGMNPQACAKNFPSAVCRSGVLFFEGNTSF